MFVCLGNICRSPLAHAVFEHILIKNNQFENYQIDSTGTYGHHAGQQSDARMKQTAADHGITINHKSQEITFSHLQDFDLIVTMDRSNYQDVFTLTRGKKELINKIKMLREFDTEAESLAGVPDPYYGGAEGFENVYQIVSRSCENLFKKLFKNELKL